MPDVVSCQSSVQVLTPCCFVFPCRGATSVVYRCEEKQTQKPYAVKVLKKTVSDLSLEATFWVTAKTLLYSTLLNERFQFCFQVVLLNIDIFIYLKLNYNTIKWMVWKPSEAAVNVWKPRDAGHHLHPRLWERPEGPCSKILVQLLNAV